MATGDEVAFITGAGRGIGKALALGFAREGYRVVVGSTTSARNEAVVGEIESEGGQAVAVSLDVAEEHSVQAAIKASLERFGQIDVLVNNAGLKPGFVPQDQKLLKDLSLAVWERMFATNVTGAFLCARECATIMTAQGRGSIINMSSGAGAHGRAGESVYAASKAALNTITRILALELKERNIAVNAITPGFTPTERMDVERLRTEQRTTALRIDTSLPLALFLAGQGRSGPLEVTGEVLDALEWNQGHGFGGREVWGLGG